MASVIPKVAPNLFPNLNRTKLMISKCNFTAGQSLKSSKLGLELSCQSEATLCLLPSSHPADPSACRTSASREAGRAGGQAVLLSGLSLVTLRALGFL